MDAKEALKCKPRLMVHSGKSSEDPDDNRNADSKGLVQTVPEETKTIRNWAKVHSKSDKNISCVLPVFYKFRVSLKVIDKAVRQKKFQDHNIQTDCSFSDLQ